MNINISSIEPCLYIGEYDATVLNMRTTLTSEDDLVRGLREKAHRQGVSFKEIVNEAIRAGLKHMDRPQKTKPYKCKSHPLGYLPRADLDHALEIAHRLESDEIARKLLLRK